MVRQQLGICQKGMGTSNISVDEEKLPTGFLALRLLQMKTLLRKAIQLTGGPRQGLRAGALHLAYRGEESWFCSGLPAMKKTKLAGDFANGGVYDNIQGSERYR